MCAYRPYARYVTLAVTAGPKRAVLDDVPDLVLPDRLNWKRVVAFAETYLTTPKGTGAGEPFRVRPWQRDIVEQLFPGRGPRPREAVLSLPRGNGKSTLAAVIACYALFADDEASPFVALVASDERQARIVYRAAVKMIEGTPVLADRVKVYQDRIETPWNGGVLMPLPAEPAALQGWDPSLTIVDELHVVRRETWEAMSLAAGKRERSLTLAISTPADQQESVMWDLVQHGRANPDDPAFRLIEYAAPDGCELDDEDAWKAANPALDDYLSRDAVRATLKTTRPDAFRRYRLGQWVGSADSWLPVGMWDACARPRPLPADGTRVVLGFDGSASGDSTVLVGATVDETPHVFLVGAWEAPENVPEWRVPRHEVTARVADAFARWDVAELAADPWGWRSELEEWQAAHGDAVVEWNTASARRMGPATDRAYALIAEQRMTHNGDDVLSRHIANAVVKSTPMGSSLSKDRRGSPRKIDAAVAAVVALDRAAWHHTNRPKRRRVAAFPA